MPISKFDFYIFQEINQFAGKWKLLDFIAIFFARYLEYVLVFFFLLFLRDWKKNRQMVFQGFTAALVARLGITEIIRWLFPRLRPFVENKVNLLLKPEMGPSLPSGHASFFFALSAIIYFYNKKTGILFFIASFLMGFFRVFSGVHWPTDILVGALVGILSAILIFRFWHYEKNS